jgi:hypothetical protein
MEQKQQTINSQTEGDEAEKTIRDIFEGKIGGDRSRKVVGHLDIRLYDLNAGQFAEVNLRLKRMFNQLRKDGVLTEDTNINTIAKAVEPNPVRDRFERLSRMILSTEEAFDTETITLSGYAHCLRGVFEELVSFQQSMGLFIKSLEGCDLDTEEGREQASKNLEAAAARVLEKARAGQPVH